MKLFFRLTAIGLAVLLIILMTACGAQEVTLTPEPSEEESMVSEDPSAEPESSSEESSENLSDGEIEPEEEPEPEPSESEEASESSDVPENSEISESSDESVNSEPEETSGQEESSEPESEESSTDEAESEESTDGLYAGRSAFSSPRLSAREPKPDEWFADAAFVGNSLTEGFYAWSGVTCGDAYAATSMTVVGVSDSPAITLDNGSSGTILQGLAQKPYGKIYILLGINEISMAPESFAAYYSDVLDKIREIQPDADIYVLGLSPVTKWKNDSSDYFNMENIRAYNAELYNLCWEKECFYIDLCAAMAGEDGYLPDDADTDGVHFVPGYYYKWYDWLKTHYAGE